MIMRKIIIIGLVFILLLNNSFCKKLKISMILWRGETPAEKGFKDSLKKLGYEIEYKIFNSNQDKNKLSTYLRNDLNISDFDYIYTYGTTVSSVVSGVIPETFPHIFDIVTYPLESGVITNMQKRTENKCGVSNIVSMEIQINLIKSILDLKTMCLIYNPREKNSNIAKSRLEELAEKYNYKIISYRAAPETDYLSKSLAEIRKKKKEIDIIYLPLDSYLITQANSIGKELKRLNLASFGAHKTFVDEGALLGAILDYYQLGEEAAKILDRNQKGDKLSNIPIFTSKSPIVLINRKTMKNIRIKIDKDILNKAQFVK